MDLANMKSLIKKNIIDFSELVLTNYNKIGLDEVDAIILIKLHNIYKKNITFIRPTELSKSLSISPKETSKRLNTLIEKGYVQMEVASGKNGKQTETFNLDYLIERILKQNYEEQTNIENKVITSEQGQLVELFESEFNKPLSVLDIQTITKWINDDEYTFDQIKDALFIAVKSRKKSIKFVDGILLNNETKPTGQPIRRTVVKDLRKLWEE